MQAWQKVNPRTSNAAHLRAARVATATTSAPRRLLSRPTTPASLPIIKPLSQRAERTVAPKLSSATALWGCRLGAIQRYLGGTLPRLKQLQTSKNSAASCNLGKHMPDSSRNVAPLVSDNELAIHQQTLRVSAIIAATCLRGGPRSATRTAAAGVSVRSKNFWHRAGK